MKTRTLLAAVLLAFTTPAFAATRVWTGAGTTNLWSDAANWSNGVPVNGDTILLLRHPLGFAQNAVNDLTNLAVQTLRCEAIGYRLTGGTLKLTGDVQMGGPIPGATLDISAPVEIPGPTLHINSTNSSELSLSGAVAAPATAVVTVDGGLRFRAVPSGDYRAETRFRSGFAGLLFTRLNGPFIVGGTATNFASIALQSRNLFGGFPPLTLLTNASVINISTFQSVGALTVEGGTLRLGNRSPDGEITVNGNARFAAGASLFVSAINSFGPGFLNVTGGVTIAGCSLAFQPGSSAILAATVILQNDGNDPVNGTFAGLPEGGVLTNNLVRYSISYVGGDGNDITLTPINEPAEFTRIESLPDGRAQLTVRGQPGFTYVIEATPEFLTAPAPTPWSPISTNLANPTGQFQAIDPDATSFARRFYRARFR